MIIFKSTKTWSCFIARYAWSYMRVDPFEIIKILTNDSSRYQFISETHPIKKRFEMDTIEWHPNLYYICITLILPSFENQYLNNSLASLTHYVLTQIATEDQSSLRFLNQLKSHVIQSRVVLRLLCGYVSAIATVTVCLLREYGRKVGNIPFTFPSGR